MKLSTDLLWELMIAGLNAPGFSERQRWELIQAAEYQGPHIGLSPLAEWWPWEVLGRKAYVPEDLVEVSVPLIYLFKSVFLFSDANLVLRTSYNSPSKHSQHAIPHGSRNSYSLRQIGFD